MKGKPTLTADLTRGQESQVLLKLQLRGLAPWDYAAIGTDEGLCWEVCRAIMRHRMFSPPEHIVQTVLELNESIWKRLHVTEEAIRALGEPPMCPASDDRHLYCQYLVDETGNALETFKANWAACVAVQERTWKWDGLVLSPKAKGVRARPGAIARPTGLRWGIAELGRAHQGDAVENVRPTLDAQKCMGMGQELPLIAALHPNWARSMNGDDIPFVDAPDLEVAPGGKGAAPCLSFGLGLRQVSLDADDVDDPRPRYGSGSLR